jgi:NADH-quinone oxidoreductase subunit C
VSEAANGSAEAGGSSIGALEAALSRVLGEGTFVRLPSLPDEIAIRVESARWPSVARALRDAPELRFQMLMDLAGIDYLHYGQDEWKTAAASGSGFSRGVARGSVSAASGARFAVVYNLLSIAHNARLRVRVYCDGDEDPVIDSVHEVWAAANWFEREAFDLYGILFRGHPDMRRLLTDYGFIGHPFRKDFPLIGNVEVRYDPARRRVVYEPVSIEPRVLVPKVIRHDQRYAPTLKSAPAKPS